MSRKEAQVSDLQFDKQAENALDELKQQKKYKVKLHLPYEEKIRLEQQQAAGKQVNWPYEPVIFNGARYELKLGIECEVPESVYEVLKNAHLV